MCCPTPPAFSVLLGRGMPWRKVFQAQLHWFYIHCDKSCSQDNMVPTKYSPFWKNRLLQPMNKMDYFSHLKVFPVAVTPGQHRWTFFQTGPQVVYIIAALTAPEELVCTQLSCQEPFRCGMGNLFMCYQELIQYPTACYTEQRSNASGVEICL